jgi:osmotically-inducible protein OsmY
MGTVVEAVRRALGAAAELDLARHPVAVAFEAGVATLEGEVADVRAKRVALERAACVPGVAHVVDRLRVAPARRMTDAEIRDHLRDLLEREEAFAPLRHAPPTPGRDAPLAPDVWVGPLALTVREGVVTLAGFAPSLAHKRLAGVLAWWVPGVRDVVNGVEVVPPEEDDDGEITDAVRLALEMDPLVDAGEIAVATRGGVVTLAGVVPSDLQRRAAERDAWCVFGVDGVRTELHARGGAPRAGRTP